ASSLTLYPQREALIPFNDLSARLKRLAALRARHSHHNRNITDLKFTDTVNRGNSLNRALRNGLLRHLAQVSLYARMRGIVQIRQRPATVFIADNTGEQDNSARRRYVRHRGIYVGDGKGESHPAS